MVTYCYNYLNTVPSRVFNHVSSCLRSISTQDSQFAAKSAGITLKLLGFSTAAIIAKKVLQYTSYHSSSKNLLNNNFNILTPSQLIELVITNAGRKKIIKQLLTVGLVAEQAMLILGVLGLASSGTVLGVVGVNCMLKCAMSAFSINDAFYAGQKVWYNPESEKCTQWKFQCLVGASKAACLTARTFKVFDTPRDLLTLGTETFSFIRRRYGNKDDTRTFTIEKNIANKGNTKEKQLSKDRKEKFITPDVLKALAVTAIFCG